MGKPLAVLAVATALLPAAAAAAPLDGTYRGRTSQHYKVKAVVKGGVLESISVPWLAHCRDKDFDWGPVKPFRWTNDPKEPIEQSGNRFSDSGDGTQHFKEGRVKSVGHISGRFSGKRVSGVQSTSARIHTKSGYRTYCKARVRFSAKLTG
jgi:hypothetical protein